MGEKERVRDKKKRKSIDEMQSEVEYRETAKYIAARSTG